MKGGLGNIMKQAQAMQEKMQQAQEELAKLEVEGSAGGGLVSVTMTCRHDVRKVTIDDDLLTEDKAVLEDLVAAAVNDAVRKVESTTSEKMSGMTAGMGLPAGMNLPF
jgi:DNA-binding YbaB/EbfC family protein